MKAAIITYSNCPNEDAGAVRQHSFAKAFKSIGFEVLEVGMGYTKQYEIYEYDDSKYVSLRNEISKNRGSFEYLFEHKKKLKFLLETQLKYCKFDVIMFRGLPYNTLQYLKRYARKNDTVLIYDCVEWYSPQQFKKGRFDLLYIQQNMYNKVWIDRPIRVIAISNYLYKNFQSKGIEVVYIPVIMDIKEIQYEKTKIANKLILLYAGQPGKKDYLKEVIEGLLLLTKHEQEKVELRIIGTTQNQLIENTGLTVEQINILRNSISIIGRVKREEVLNQLSTADFTVLLRSTTQRYAKAGFPTKVVESLASGTPVMLNLTSDLGNYIHDMKEGIIIEDCTSDAFAVAIRKALSLNRNELISMQKNARDSAVKNFDYIHYVNELKILLSKGREVYK